MNDTFRILIKSGNICNLKCFYCFDNCSGQPERFSLKGLNILMKQLSSLPYKRLTFAWHGGEPLTAGIDYFRDVLNIQEQFQHKHQKICNSLHTNGTLLDKKWVDFLATYYFSVGISLDGPKKFNDSIRKFESGKGTFDQICDSIKLLRESGLGVSISITVQENSWKIVNEFYSLCKDLDVDAIEFWPLLQHHHNNLSGIKSVSVKAYSKFLKALYYLWLKDRKAGVWHPHIYLFEDLMSQDKGFLPSLCWFNRGACLSNIMVDLYGNVYPCDSFRGYESMCMGNLYEDDLATMFSGIKYHNYIINAQKLPEVCLNCELAKICNGGCVYQRYLSSRDLSKSTYYCAANRILFESIRAKTHDL